MADLNSLISDIQMLALSLSTQGGAEERRLILIKIREISYEATSEVTSQLVAAKPPREPTLTALARFGVNDL